MNGASFRWIDALFSFEAMKVLLERVKAGLTPIRHGCRSPINGLYECDGFFAIFAATSLV